MSDWQDEGDTTRLERFRARVFQTFGADLEKATPANVRDFMECYQEEELSGSTKHLFELNESKTTYEEILKDFFARVLERPSEDALILLWLMSFEMSFYAIEQQLSERLQSLFGDVDDTP